MRAAAGPIARVGALLINFPGALRASQLIPANAGAAVACVHRMIRQQRGMIAKVAVDQAVHQTIADGIQAGIAGNAGLRNAMACDPNARQGRPGRRGQDQIGLPALAESRIGGRRPVYMKLPQAQGVLRPNPGSIIYFGEIARRAGGRRRAIQIGGQHPAKAEVDAGQIEMNQARRQALQHL